MADIATLLENATSMDGNTRNQAEQGLSQLREQNYPQYMVAMAGALHSSQLVLAARQMAGFCMKIVLDAKDLQMREMYHNNWKNLSRDVRSQIKNALVETFASPERDVGMVAAQVVGKIASIELPHDEWPDLIPGLLGSMESPNPNLKRATLDTLGYICEGVSPAILEPSLNSILTAVVAGMQTSETDMDVRLSAAKALNNALDFITTPFDNADERDYLMTIVCGCAFQGTERVRKEGMQCLVKIVQYFYDKMESYMQTLIGMTLTSIMQDPEEIARQAIEFWNTICEEEQYLDQVEKRAKEQGEQPPAVSVNYIRHALTDLVGILLKTMCRQEDDQDEDSWNIAMAAGTCLSLVANTVGDDIVPHVFPFVQQQIENQDWHMREAAVFAFGSILEGASSAACQNLIATGIPLFVGLMSDPVPLVGETSAWTLGRICKFHGDCIQEDHVNPLVMALLEGLGLSPKIAANCAWSVANLSSCYREKSDNDETYPLSPFFANIMETLLRVTEREDADESKLRGAAYTAINNLIEEAPKDCDGAVFTAFQMLVERLEMSVKLPPDPTGQVIEVQALICAALQVVTQKTGELIQPFADQLMTLYIQVLSARDSTVHEECLLAVGALASAINGYFGVYMGAFMNYLKIGLTNSKEYQVVQISVGVVGDICRALEGDMYPYSQDIMPILHHNLEDEYLRRDVKPSIIACFGDFALALGGAFQQYLDPVMRVLQEASNLEVDMENEELVAYLHELRENILDAYSGIVQGMNTAERQDLLTHQYVDQMMHLVYKVYQDPRPEEVTKNAVALMGDLVHTLGTKMQTYMQRDFVMPLVRECLRAEEEDAVEVAHFAQKVIKGILKGV